MEKHSIYDETVDTWGPKQPLIVVEELSELIKEVCKWQRHGEIPEALYGEIADVQIVLTQLENMCRRSDPEAMNKIAAAKEFKLKRLRERLDAWYATHGRPSNH